MSEQAARPRPQTRAFLSISTRLMLAAAIILPMLMTAAAGWLSWHQAWREAKQEATHAAEISAEYARRVFDGLMLRIDRAGDALAGLSDDQIRTREAELHTMLRRAAIAGPREDDQREPFMFAFDRHGHILVSGQVLPVPRDQSFAHREFNQALRHPEAPPVHVSPVYVGSVTGEAFFAVTRRRIGAGNGLPPDAYDGVINASVFVREAEAALQRMARGARGDVLSLIRADGAVLARSIPVPPGTRVGEGSPLHAAIQSGQHAILLVGPSTLDGVDRIVAFRRVADYAVYAAAARPRSAVVQRWSAAMLPLLVTGVVATMMMAGLALMVRRRHRDLAKANAVLEDRVDERTAALAESAARLRRVRKVGRVGGFEIDLRSGENFRSSEYMALHGGAAVARTEQHADWVARLHPEDRERAEHRFLSAVARGETEYEQEYRVVAAAGETRWIAARADIERDRQGTPLRMVGAHVDVTALKVAQAAMLAGDARLRAALLGARLGTWERHLPTASAHWDARAAEIYGGLTPERCSPDLSEWRARVHPDDRAARIAAVDAAIAAGGSDSYEVEFRFGREDGSWSWIAVHGSVVERDASSGRGVRLAGVVQDLTERHAADAALRASEERLRLAQDAGGVGSWEWTVETNALYWSESCHGLHGTDPATPLTMEDWRRGIHPEDWGAVAATIEAARDGGTTDWSLEYRFTRKSDGALRWIRGRGTVERDAATGGALRLRGIALDVTQEKAAEDLRQLLMQEVDHRAKNILSVVQAVIRMTPRNDNAAYVQAVEGRVDALARTHTLLAQGRWTGADLLTLARGELAPFMAPDDSAKAPLVTIEGPSVQVSSAAAQGLSMALHELATNATKHGALSVPGGRLSVAWSVDEGAGLLCLRWEERCGPPVGAAPAHRGFGTRVLDGMIKHQLGGSVHCHWESSGLVCEMKVPLKRVLDLNFGIF